MLTKPFKKLQQYLIPKYALTVYAGFVANIKIPRLKNRLIRRFILKYGVNMQEALRENIEDYTCFNDFFIRQLKPSCRPIAQADIVSPVDGSISEMGQITQGQLLQAKGRYYSVHELLAGNEQMSAQFSRGLFITLYLSPKDYHRIHMPMDAVLQEMIYVPGRLFSVQPATVNVIPHLFARNERVVALFQTKIGPMAMILVGATIVGRIATTWHGELRRSRKIKRYVYSENDNITTIYKKAMEMGYFKLGSTVILLFANDSPMKWCAHINPGQTIKLGDELGNIL